MSSHFAVLVGVQVEEDDVIFVGQEDEVIFILPVEAAQVPQGNLQLNHTLQHEMIVIQDYYLLLRCQSHRYLLSIRQIDKRIHFFLKSQHCHLALGMLQHSIVVASIGIIVALLDDLVGIVIHVVVFHVHALVTREELVFLLLTQLTLQDQAVPHLPAVVEIRRKRVQSEAADGGLDVGRVAILAPREVRGRLREEPFALQASIEPLLHPAIPILVLYNHQLPRSVPQYKLRLADCDGG